MKNMKHFILALLGKAAVCAALAAVSAAPLFAQTAEVRSAGVYYKNNALGTDQVYCNWGNSVVSDNNDVSFTTKVSPSSNANKNDPWVSSALIEYDQPYPSPNVNNNYPNHCLALCMDVYCTNKPMAQSTYSIAFPLQQVKFDIVKYYNGKNVENPEETPAIRTIDLYPDTESDSAICGSYHCPGGPTEGYVCPSPQYEFRNGRCYQFGTNTTAITQCGWDANKGTYNNANSSSCPNMTCNWVIFNNDGTPSNQPITFCAAWDGSYEIAGEFGKSNGDFAFRSTEHHGGICPAVHVCVSAE